MAPFWQRWSLMAGLVMTTFLLSLMQQEHRCPDLYQLWQEEKMAGHDPLPDLIKAAGLELKEGGEMEDADIEPRLDEHAPTPRMRQPTPGLENPRVLKRFKDRMDDYRPKVETLSHELLLQRRYIPNTVFYVWCGKRWFEFHHYLSVKSVIRELKPDNLIFYYDEEPVTDYWIYNTWFKELKEEYPFFRARKFNENEPWGKGCDGLARPDMKFIYRRLNERGGMYMNEFTILDTLPQWYRNYTVVNALDPVTRKGFLMSKARVPLQDVFSPNGSKKLKTKKITCAGDNSTYNSAPKKTLCVNTNTVFFPENIWELDTHFGQLVRRILYGTPRVLKPIPSYDTLIPNIAHVVWIGGGQMDFLFYLGVLSLIYVAKVDNVYIHGNGPPTGPYWDRIKHHKKINIIFRETPKTVYGTEVKVLSHITDVWRVDFMIRYGGIYVDTDTVFVKPLDTVIRGYDAVGSVDWTYWNPPFPDTINFGVAIGKRDARYWHEFQKTNKWWIDKDWSWNGLRQPYKVKEKFPELVKIDPHLQIICYQFKCHPTWWPDYHNESIHHLNSPSITDWREEAYAFHWTLPTPPELISEEAALNTNSMFAEIAKFVLHQAGVYKSDFELKHTKFKLPVPPKV